MKIRLQKLMAEADIASRRGAEELIEQGRVRVNGKLAKVGDKADPETDVVEVNGEKLQFKPQKKVYFALYKPRQVLSTSLPHRGDERQTVLNFIPYEGHLFTVGRLDADSEGLIVLTNDGDLTHRLTHPSFVHTKTYKVTVQGLPSEDVINRWEEGVWLEEDGRTAPCSVTIIKGSVRETVLRIVMTEGKKRQIRRVALTLGHRVESLVRTDIGMLSVEGLRPGEWRELSPKDIHALGMPSPVLKEIRAKQWERRTASRRTRAEGSRSPGFGATRDSFGNRPHRGLVKDIPREEAQPRRNWNDEVENQIPSERPKRAFNVTRPGGDRPRRTPTGDSSEKRPGRGYGGERSENTERSTQSADDRPRRPSSDRPSGDRPRRPSSDRPSGDRPRRPSSDRPSGDRPARSFGDKPTGDRPRRPSSDRPSGDRPARSFGDKPTGDRPRRPSSDRPSGDRPARSNDDAASGERPARSFEYGSRSSNPRRPPQGTSSGAPRRGAPSQRSRPQGENNRSKRPSSDRPAGSRSGGQRPPRSDSRPSSSTRSSSPRPTGGDRNRPSTPRSTNTSGDNEE